MTTNVSFNDMILEYLPFDLLTNDFVRRNWLLSQLEIDNSWKGGELSVPFRAARATSYSYGSLTAESEITEYDYVRGTVTGYREIWGTMKWNARDLDDHDGTGKVNKQSFLKNLPGQIDDFLEGMKDIVSVNLLVGTHFAKLTADASANDGNITVDHPERFELGQKVVVDDDNSSPITAWVKAIDLNAAVINLVTTKGGSTVVDFSATGAAMTMAQNAKVYVPGADTASNAFTSLRSQILSAAAGGSSTLFGQSKLAYPYLQALNISATTAGITSASTVLAGIFNAWTLFKQRGVGVGQKCVMSYKHLASIMKTLESASAAYRHVDTKVNAYGYTEITVVGVKGQVDIVAVHEMDDDVIYFLDFSSMKLFTNGGFRKQVSPEGIAYHTVRATSGYTYICDIKFFGELVVQQPRKNAAIYGISY